MKTITTLVYDFDDLDDDAKENAVRRHQHYLLEIGYPYNDMIHDPYNDRLDDLYKKNGIMISIDGWDLPTFLYGTLEITDFDLVLETLVPDHHQKAISDAWYADHDAIYLAARKNTTGYHLAADFTFDRGFGTKRPATLDGFWISDGQTIFDADHGRKARFEKEARLLGHYLTHAVISVLTDEIDDMVLAYDFYTGYGYAYDDLADNNDHLGFDKHGNIINAY